MCVDVAVYYECMPMMWITTCLSAPLPYKTLTVTATFHYTSRIERIFLARDFEGSRLFIVLLKFGALNIEERRVIAQKESWREQYRSRKLAGERQIVRKVPPVQEAPRRVRDNGDE